MQIQQNISLKQYNTFGIDVSAQYFSSFSDINELEDILAYAQTRQLEKLIIGGGSNILFTKNFNGIVAKNNLSSITLVKEDAAYYYVKANAGEVWHNLVMHCIENNYGGIENLSLIPGCVGAAPMQNIGAYGIELKDIFFELEAYDTEDKKMIVFNLNDCEFGYRESVFKTKYKGRFVIVSITLKLTKNHIFHTKYGAIEHELERMNINELSIKNISQAVINIRSSKLPNPKEIGNAGSFFKNPVIDSLLFDALIKQYPGMPHYPASDNMHKLAAGWLIEQCNFKGYRKNDAGCHAKQALVLVNYVKAKGQEILDLSNEIIQTVKEKFNVTLEREVNII